jgi:hypothetical protein
MAGVHGLGGAPTRIAAGIFASATRQSPGGFQWPGLEHKIHGGTEPCYSFQSEFGQLTGLESRQG